MNIDITNKPILVGEKVTNPALFCYNGEYYTLKFFTDISHKSIGWIEQEIESKRHYWERVTDNTEHIVELANKFMEEEK